MLATSEVGRHGTGYALLGIALCVGGLAFFIHSIIYRRKASTHIQITKKSVEADYTRAFPPSQRATLFDVSAKAVDQDLSRQPLLRLTEDYRLAKPSTYIFSGFTVGDVRTLGDFPDYAKLSGVPLPLPLKNFNVENAVPRPYRPFRWAYHQTMSFKKLDPDYWLELESTYSERIRQRQELYAKHGSDVLQALPGSELACKELMEMVLQFLCARYPQQFEVLGKTFMNHILGTQHDLASTPPLKVILDNIPEDFAMMLRDPDTGRYVFRAGVICSSVGWNLGEKIGKGLPGIHQPVPDYKEKMEFSMDRFFSKMPTFNPIQRGSWGLEIGQPLYLPADHPDFSHRESQNPSLRPGDLYLRVDWQTLRRLPLSGAVVFNFKALFTPLAEFEDEPYIPSIVLKILNEGKENLMKYKGIWHVEHVAKPTLERYERSQLDKGLIEKDWKHQTLDEYPFFQGWERKYPLA